MHIFDFIDNIFNKENGEVLKSFILVAEWVFDCLNKLFILVTGNSFWLWALGLVIAASIFYLVTTELDISREGKFGKFLQEVFKNIVDWVIDIFSKKK